MAHVVADRVKDTSTTTGTGNLTLSGAAPSGFRTFGSVLANNDTCFYAVEHQSAAEWEVGLGTYVSATPALARTSVIASSNAGAAVNFSAGTKNCFITSPAVAQGSGVLSPAQIAADTNDYNPTGLSLANILRLDTDNVRYLTGLQGGYDGRRILLHVLPAAQGPLILRDENASSSAANRFTLSERRVFLWPGDSLDLWYDGTAARWKQTSDVRTNTHGGDYIEIFEEFLSGVLGSGTATEAGESIGSWDWRSTANGTSASGSPAGVSLHPGVVQLVTAAVSGNDTRLHLGNAATDDIFPFNEVRYVGTLVNTSNITSNRIKFGLGVDLGDGTLGAFGTDAVMFEFDTATSANWRCITRAASTNTLNTSGVALVNNEWDLLEAIRLTNGNWAFLINETLLFTHTTNLPTAVMSNVGLFVETQTAAARSVNLDWLRLRTTRYGQRYT